MIPSVAILILGVFAQVLFAGRMLVQWILSERSKTVVSPKLFWRISLVASMMMCMYGWLRNDVAILVGQLITYFIYIRNLQLKNDWQQYPLLLRIFIFILPIVVFGYMLSQELSWSSKFTADVATWLIVMGIAGQLIFTFRFIVQYYYSEKIKLSVLPPQFWILSLVGSIIIFIYGIYRQDAVLLMGHGFGMIAYVRNIMIGRKEKEYAEA